MARITLLRGTAAAGEGVVRLMPNIIGPGERWLASVSEPHLSLIAIGARRIPLAEALELARETYLGLHAPDWNVMARLQNAELTLQPLADLERSPAAHRLTIKAGQSRTLTHGTAFALLCQHGEGVVSRVAVQSPSVLHDARLTPDEVFVTGEAARRGVAIRNASASEPLVLLQILSEDITS